MLLFSYKLLFFLSKCWSEPHITVDEGVSNVSLTCLIWEHLPLVTRCVKFKRQLVLCVICLGSCNGSFVFTVCFFRYVIFGCILFRLSAIDNLRYLVTVLFSQKIFIKEVSFEPECQVLRIMQHQMIDDLSIEFL